MNSLKYQFHGLTPFECCSCDTMEWEITIKLIILGREKQFQIECGEMKPKISEMYVNDREFRCVGA